MIPLEQIYRQVPRVKCKGLCTASCGPIGMSSKEWQRFRRANDGQAPSYDPDTLRCNALVDGRCTVYTVRPLVCRLWGAVEKMPCPHGCEVEKLSDAVESRIWQEMRRHGKTMMARPKKLSEDSAKSG